MQMYMDHNARDPNIAVLLTCGAVSCTCGQLASYPLALVRTRLQVRLVLIIPPPPPSRPLSSKPFLIVHCFTTPLQASPGNTNTMRQEFRVVYSQGGFRALYFGMAANVLKVVPAVSIRSVTSNGYQVRPRAPGSFLQPNLLVMCSPRHDTTPPAAMPFMRHPCRGSTNETICYEPLPGGAWRAPIPSRLLSPSGATAKLHAAEV